jgi:hypothetical protein
MTVTSMKRTLLAAAALATCWPAPYLHAQAPARRYRVMLGPALNSVNPWDSDVGKDMGPGLIVRGVPRRGLGPVVDLSFFTLDLKRKGQPRPLGELRLRTLLAGIGYTIERGRLATTFAVAAGHAFTKAESDLQDVHFDVSSAPLARTSVTFTWSAGRRIALLSSLGAVFVEPKVTLQRETADGPLTETGTWRAHSYVWQLGVAIKVF